MGTNQVWLNQGLCPAELLTRRLCPIDKYEKMNVPKHTEGTVVRSITFHNPNFSDAVINLAWTKGDPAHSPLEVEHLMMNVTVPARAYASWVPPVPVILPHNCFLTVSSDSISIIASVWGNTP